MGEQTIIVVPITSVLQQTKKGLFSASLQHLADTFTIRNAMGLSGGVVVVCEVEVYSSYISSKFSFSDYNNKRIIYYRYAPNE